MSIAYHAAIALTSGLAVYYGVSCLLPTKAMEAEFERFGLGRFRILTGCLEIAGAVGLLLGYVVPVLRIAAGFGIGLLMLLVVIWRVVLRDGVALALPAIIFGALAIWIAVRTLSAIG